MPVLFPPLLYKNQSVSPLVSPPERTAVQIPSFSEAYNSRERNNYHHLPIAI